MGSLCRRVQLFADELNVWPCGRLADAHILFTLDGSDPACPRARAAGVVQTYYGPFKLGVGSFKVTAIARCSDKVDSIPLTSVLIIKARCTAPVLKPPPGLLEVPSTRTSTPMPGSDFGDTKGKRQASQGARRGTSESAESGGGGGQITLSTRTWDVKPDAKIHYSIYSVKSMPGSDKGEGKGKGDGDDEGGDYGPRIGDDKKSISSEVLIFQGFYNGPFSLPPSRADADGECEEEQSYRVRAIAMHASMLPSEQVSGVYTVPRFKSLSPQQAGGRDGWPAVPGQPMRDKAEGSDTEGVIIVNRLCMFCHSLCLPSFVFLPTHLTCFARISRSCQRASP